MYSSPLIFEILEFLESILDIFVTGKFITRLKVFIIFFLYFETVWKVENNIPIRISLMVSSC